MVGVTFRNQLQKNFVILPLPTIPSLFESLKSDKNERHIRLYFANQLIDLIRAIYYDLNYYDV